MVRSIEGQDAGAFTGATEALYRVRLNELARSPMKPASDQEEVLFGEARQRPKGLDCEAFLNQSDSRGCLKRLRSLPAFLVSDAGQRR